MDTPNVRSTSGAGWLEAAAGAPPDTPWVQRNSGRWQWQVQAEWAWLLADGSPDWSNLANDSRAERIKVNDGREVWRVRVGAQLLFAKVARPPRKWARLRRLVFGCDAAREWRIAEYASRHGIRTVSPVAFAEAPIDGRSPISILITEGLPAAVPLNEFWAGLNASNQAGRETRARLIDSVASLIAQAHQCGFEHLDLHAGNVLIDVRRGGDLRPLFVDLHNVRTGAAVDEQTVARNLCQFNQWFRSRAALTDRIRFLHRYLAWREQLEGSSPLAVRLRVGRRELVRRIDAEAEGHAEHLYAKRDRRILRTGRYFAGIKLRDGWRAHVFLESKHRVAGSRASELVFTPEQWRSWLDRPLRWVQPEAQRDLIKDSAATKVCRGRLPHPDGPLEVVCKRASSRNLYKRVQYLLRCSRPMMTWRVGNALLHRQVATARPLAVVERRRCGLLVDSLIITEYVEDACDLDTLLTVQMREMGAAQERRLKLDLTRELSAAVRSLLARGYAHRDFKAPNVIVQWHAERCPRPRVVLVDLDGVRPARWAERKLLSMLVRLNVSLEHCRRVTRTDRLRFLMQCYARYGRWQRSWRSLWKEVEARSGKVRAARERRQAEKFKKFGRF